MVGLIIVVSLCCNNGIANSQTIDIFFIQTGQFQLLEQGTNSPSNMIMYNTNSPEGTAVTAFDVSNTCQALSFVDTGGEKYC